MESRESLGGPSLSLPVLAGDSIHGGRFGPLLLEEMKMKKLAILLTVVFVALKLCGVIAWSWLVRFAPVLAFTAFILGAILLSFCVAMVAHRG